MFGEPLGHCVMVKLVSESYAGRTLIAGWHVKFWDCSRQERSMSGKVLQEIIVHIWVWDGNSANYKQFPVREGIRGLQLKSVLLGNPFQNAWSCLRNIPNAVFGIR